MGTILTIIGIILTVAAIGIILMSSGKKKGLKESGNIDLFDFNELELEYRNLKNDAMEITKEFNRSANYYTNLLDEKVVYLSEIREDIDKKIIKMTRLMTDIEITTQRLEKLKESSKYEHQARENEEKIIKLPQKTRIMGAEDTIYDLIDKGMTTSEVSEKTGKSIGEIDFIMKLRNKR